MGLDAELCQQISFRVGYEARRRLSLDDGRRQASRGRRERSRSCGREWRRVWDRDTQHLAEIVQGPEDLGEVEAQSREFGVGQENFKGAAKLGRVRHEVEEPAEVVGKTGRPFPHAPARWIFGVGGARGRRWGILAFANMTPGALV